MAKYPTKKFDCWQLAKEMQTRTFEGVMTAREEGKILLAGSSGWQGCFLNGLVGADGFAFLPSEAYKGSTDLQTL